MMNTGRTAQGGQDWEGFSASPFLAGVGAYLTTLGLLSAGVQACASITSKSKYPLWGSGYGLL